MSPVDVAMPNGDLFSVARLGDAVVLRYRKRPASTVWSSDDKDYLLPAAEAAAIAGALALASGVGFAPDAPAKADAPVFDRRDFDEAVFGRMVPVDDRYELPQDVVERGAAVYEVVEAPVAVRVMRYLGEDGEGGALYDRESRIDLAGLTTEQAAERALALGAEVEA